MARPLKSLWWSGVAAGLAMATSLLGEAIVERSLPAHASYAASLSAVGYSLGFLIVVLGHLQLFTENTITTLLPVLRRRTWSCVASMLRLWSVVFLANLVGAGLAGWTLSSGTVGPSLLATMEHIAERATAADFGTNFLRAIPAGFMVAAIVWLTRLEKPTRFWVIVVLTWAIAAGGFSHVIVGSVEVFLLLFQGSGSPTLFGSFVLPALLGNIVGGSFLFALLAYAQVAAEVDPVPSVHPPNVS